LGVLGLLLGYYFFKAAQPTFRVGYVFDTELVAQLDEPSFSLQKDGVSLPVRSLFRTEIAVWNAGTAPIDPGSVRRPLTIEFSSKVQVIAAKIEKASHNVSLPVLTKDTSKITLDWRYFDPNFYFVVQLYQSTAEPPQISLRYIGDREIAGAIPRKLADSGYDEVVIFGLGAIIILVLGTIGNWVANKATHYVTTSGKVQILKEKVPRENFRFLIYMATCIIFGSLVLYSVVGKINMLGRAVFGFSVPSGISEFISIDESKSVPK
jgi:hypothetical protein